MNQLTIDTNKDLCLNELEIKNHLIVKDFFKQYKDLIKIDLDKLLSLDLNSIFIVEERKDKLDPYSELIRLRILIKYSESQLDQKGEAIDLIKSKKQALIDVGKKILKDIDTKKLFYESSKLINGVNQLKLINQIRVVNSIMDL